jgi:2-dehydro-3-deoxygluconokinase
MKHKMKKVFCFGELLLRLSPALSRQWIHEASMPVYVGGAELNTSFALANWGVPVKYSTALPSHYLAEEICDHLQEGGIDTSAIHFGGERIGMYFLPQGTDLKGAGVIYDRAYSSFASLKRGQLDWDKMLEGCDWFHFSAISPALNPEAVAVCEEGLKVASAKGMTISVDLNYRARLWQYGKKPDEVMPSLVKYCDVVMGNVWAAEMMLDIPLKGDALKVSDKVNCVAQAELTTRAIMNAYPQCRMVANTYRFTDEKGQINYYAVAADKKGTYVSKEFTTSAVVDKVGSGDCFMAGMIYGMKEGENLQATVDFAASAAFGKLQEMGDVTSQTIEQIKKRLYAK